MLFVLFAGTIFVYVSAEPPRLSVLLRGGVAYFWRFVRAAILAGCVAAVILGILLALRAALLARAGDVYVERQMFLYSAISAGRGSARRLAGASLVGSGRGLYRAQRHGRRTQGPPGAAAGAPLAWAIFLPHRGQFLAQRLLWPAHSVSAFFGKFVPAHQVWPAFLLAQLGLFLLLAGRFWQRGIEATLVMSADPPIVAVEEMMVEEEDMPVVVKSNALVGLSEPTLRELVQKLRTSLGLAQAGPTVPPRPSPEPTLAADPPKEHEPQTSILARHATKFLWVGWALKRRGETRRGGGLRRSGKTSPDRHAIILGTSRQLAAARGTHNRNGLTGKALILEGFGLQRLRKNPLRRHGFSRAAPGED